MLYFEDFMEAIENLPAELSETLTTVRQLDLLTQNTLEPLREVTRAFFEDCKYDRLSEFEKTMQHSEMVKEYDKALSYCREKREMVEKVYNTYTKLIRKLDSELEKFRLELEADNSGITEQIEQRMNAILGRNAAPVSKPEKRRQRFRFQQPSHFKNPFLMRRRIVGQACRTVLKNTTGRPNHAHKISEQIGGRFTRVRHQRSLKSPSNAFHQLVSKTSNASSHELSDSGKIHEETGSGRRLHTGDSQETDMFSPDGAFDPSFGFSTTRSDYSNTPNTKSDLEADQEDLPEFTNNLSALTAKSSPFFTLGTQLDVSTPSTEKGSGRPVNRQSMIGEYATFQPDIADRTMNTSSSSTTAHGTSLIDSRLVSEPCPVSWPTVPGLRERRPRSSRRPTRDNLLDELIPDALRTTDPVTFDETASSGPGSTTDGLFDPSTVGFVQDMKLDNPDDALEEDEDEKRYCWCHNVSYGDMIACDAPNCPYEWFHYGCVNLTVAPKGSWYCPSCIKSQTGTKGFKKRVPRK